MRTLEPLLLSLLLSSGEANQHRRKVESFSRILAKIQEGLLFAKNILNIQSLGSIDFDAAFVVHSSGSHKSVVVPCSHRGAS